MHFNSKSSKKTNRIIATVLALLNTVECAKFCTSSNSICVVSTKDAATQQTCFTIHSASNGWASIGVGSSSMSGSDMYIAWKNKSGVAAVYNFQGVGHSIKEGTQGNVIPQPTLLDPQPSWSKMSVSFCRSKNAVPALTDATQYIYAAAASPPSGDLNSASASVGMHDDGSFGVAKANFLSASGTTVGSSSNGAILQTTPAFTMKMVSEIHGAIMWVAWTLCPMVGIFVARYGKDILGHNWYRIHMALMGGITFLFSIVGFLVIFLYRPPQHFVGLTNMTQDVHVKAGLAVCIGVVVQVALGYLSNHLWTPDRTFIPLVDKLHWWLGRSLTVLGIAVSYMGFLVYQNNYQVLKNYYLILFWVFVGFGAALFVYGEMRIGQIHHAALPGKDDEEKKH